jgi:hypothetical protein
MYEGRSIVGNLKGFNRTDQRFDGYLDLIADQDLPSSSERSQLVENGLLAHH